MTLEKFVEEYRHEIGGLVADAFVTEAKSGELSIRMRLSFRAIDRILAEIHGRLTPAITPTETKR